MFIKVMIDGETQLINTAHVAQVRKYRMKDGETEKYVDAGTMFTFSDNPGHRVWTGDDFEKITELLTNSKP